MEEKKSNFHLRTVRLCGILLFSVALFYAAVCTPVSRWTIADIGVSDVFRLIWDFLLVAVKFAFYWLAASFILCSVRNFGRAKTILLLAGGAAFLLNFGSLAAGLLMTRDLDTIGADLLSAALSVLLDIAQLLLFRLFAYLTMERRRADGIPSRSMLFCAAVPSALQLIGRLIYDLGVGAPTGKTDLIVMISYYLADLASVAIGYLAILLLTERLTDSKESRT